MRRAASKALAGACAIASISAFLASAFVWPDAALSKALLGLGIFAALAYLVVKPPDNEY